MRSDAATEEHDATCEGGDVSTGTETADVAPVGHGPSTVVDGNAEAAGGDAISDREHVFEVLSNERRRLVLRYLREEDASDGVAFRDLVDQVAAWENDTTIDRLDSSDRKCVYTALRQTHLPKLDELDVVEYDNQRGEVEPTEVLEDVLMYMEYVPEDDVTWSRFYLLLSAASTVLVFFVWIGIPPFGGVSGLALAVLVAGLFGISSIVQARQSAWIRIGSDERAIE